MATPPKRPTLSPPACPYGKRCYRTNPQHLLDFFHPKKDSPLTNNSSDSKSEHGDSPPASNLSDSESEHGDSPMASNSSDSESELSSSTLNSPRLPACKYGGNCYRKNLLHFSQFWHPFTIPKDNDSKRIDQSHDADCSQESQDSEDHSENENLPSTSSKNDLNLKRVALHSSDNSKDNNTSSNSSEINNKRKVSSGAKCIISSGDDTDELDSEEEQETSDGTSLVNRGLSLVRKYSELSESERKELVKRAIEAKLRVEKKLKTAKAKIKEKCLEMQELQSKYNSGLVVEGEAEAMKSDEVVLIPLHAKREYSAGSAEEIHFRLAESQFYRLLSGGFESSNYRITLVEYVINADLVKKFQTARESLKQKRGEKLSHPVLGFHGTKDSNITSICQGGFKVPGEAGFKQTTDSGYYGRGVYFSEYPSYCMSYINGSSKLLLCQVLLGRVFQCKDLIHGQSCQPGYDSHTSPDKQELVVFNSDHILPCYIVHYVVNISGQFSYKDVDNRTSLTKYNKAKSKSSSALFSGEVFHFCGNFECFSWKELSALVVKHGAKLGQRYYTNLISTGTEFENGTSKIQEALVRGVPCVGSNYIFDSIISGSQKDPEDYGFN